MNLTLRNVKIEDAVVYSVKGLANRKGEDLQCVYLYKLLGKM